MSEPPEPAPGFRWVPAPWGVLLVADALEAFRHGWTPRQLQLRGSTYVEGQGWAEVASAAGVELEWLVRLRQVHGSHVHLADRHVPSPEPPEADAAVSSGPGRALAVQVADCVPLLLADRSSGAVGVAHAGWRGTAAGVSGKAADALSAFTGGATSSIAAAIGPSIGPCCYEVGPELLDAFLAAGWTRDDGHAWFERRDGRWFLDLWRANADQLARRGVPPAAIHLSRLCTSCHPDWFPSYRRDGAGAGRAAGFIRGGAAR